MDLKQRLTALRGQRSVPATEAAATLASVSERLQRLRGDGDAASASVAREARVAERLGGTCLAAGLIVVERHLPLTTQHGRRLLAAITALQHPTPPANRALPTARLLFLDTETTGLAGGTGTLIFLLGLGRIDGETLTLRQWFLTGFGGETALLRDAAAWSSGRDHLVTFNGKSFDVPLLATRYRLARLHDPFTVLDHIDLFHPTRRAFRQQWPDCRLQTAERRLLGFTRRDDLPSHLVPETWFRFVRQGHMQQLPALLDHNRWDLVSLVALLPALTEAFVSPGTSGADVTAIARYWLQRGHEATALQHLQEHQETLSQEGLLELARLYKRRQQWQAALAIWQQLATSQCPEAIEQLAKYYEHVQRDYATALTFTQHLQRLQERNPQHQQRAQRLRRKELSSAN